MRPLEFAERFHVSLELYSEGWIGWIRNPTHDSLEALGAHLRGKLATALKGGLAVVWFGGFKCVSHCHILHRSAICFGKGAGRSASSIDRAH